MNLPRPNHDQKTMRRQAETTLCNRTGCDIAIIVFAYSRLAICKVKTESGHNSTATVDFDRRLFSRRPEPVRTTESSRADVDYSALSKPGRSVATDDQEATWIEAD